MFPSFYSHLGGSGPGGRNLFGDEVLIPRADLEVRNYMSRDSVVEDWDTAARMWEHMLVDRLQPPRSTPPVRNGLNIGDDGDVTMEDSGAIGNGNGNGDMMGNGSNGDDIAAALAAEEGEAALGESPLLMTEAPWNSAKAREKAIEIAMEGWGCPAFWLSRTPVLAAFAAGKATALVVDVGGANTSVAAVHDGMILKRSVQKSPVAGLWLSGQIRSMWEAADPRVELVPLFSIENKRPVEAGAPADVRLKKFPFAVADSFRLYEEERTLTEFKESVVEVWRGPGKYLAPGNEEYAKSQPGRVFEMPDGSNQMWREQRFRVSEGMWDETAAYPIRGGAGAGVLGVANGTGAGAATAIAPAAVGTPAPTAGATAATPATPATPAAPATPGATTTTAAAATPVPGAGLAVEDVVRGLTKAQTIPELIKASLSGVDVDLRPALLANVVVTGSTSLLNGFNDRLNNELTAMYPGLRVKLHAAGLTSERRFGAWIGGSILASLGTFHQMWISRAEYQENGAAIVEKRCK